MFLDAIDKLRNSGIKCLHSPDLRDSGETDEQLIETAKVYPQKIDGVKHNLHVLQGTPLEQIFSKGFCPLSLKEYTRKVALSRISGSFCSSHRLAAVASRWNELAPEWNHEKMKQCSYRRLYAE